MTAVEVKPVTSPIDATVVLPASKSQLIRSLTAAALAPGRSHLYGATSFDDSDAITDVINALGASVRKGRDLWTVDGVDGRLAVPTTPLDCRESGLSARIAIALAASIDGMSTVIGRGRLTERPFGGLIEILRAQGVEIHGDSPPLEIRGNGPLWGGEVEVDASLTTQFATALMLVAPIMRNPLTIEITGLSGSTGYLGMTQATIAEFGVLPVQTTTGFEVPNGGYTSADVVIESDASAAVYPVVLAALSRGRVQLAGLSAVSRQPDLAILEILSQFGCQMDRIGNALVFDASEAHFTGFEVDLSESPDGAIALAVLALAADGPSRLGGLGSLRHKESDRLDVIVTEATKLGATILNSGDTIEIEPTPLHNGTVDPHGDHRIAMAFATLVGAGLELRITNPQVVDKTWPGYWQILDNLAEK